MNIYIWDDAEPVSDNYHDSGGVVVVAEDLTTARAQWAEWSKSLWNRGYAVHSEEEVKSALAQDPDHTYPLEGEHEPKVIIHLNAGCC